MLIRESGNVEVRVPDDAVSALPFLGALVRNWSGVTGALVGAASDRQGVPYGAWYFKSKTMLLKLGLLKKACRGVLGSPEWVAENAEALGVFMHESGHAAHTRHETQAAIARRLSELTGYSEEECHVVVTLIEEPRIEALQISRMSNTSSYANRRYGRSDITNGNLAQSYLLAMSTNLLMAEVIDMTEEEKSEMRQALRLAILVAGRGLYFYNPEANTAANVTIDHRHLSNIQAIKEIFDPMDWAVIDQFIKSYCYRWAHVMYPSDEDIARQFLDLWFRKPEDEESEGAESDEPKGEGEPCDNPPPNPGENGKPGDEPGDEEAEGGEGPGEESGDAEGDEPGEGGSGGSSKDSEGEGESGTPGDDPEGSEGGSRASEGTPKPPMGEMGKKVRRVIEELAPRELLGGSSEGTEEGPGVEVDTIRDEIRSQVQINHDDAQEIWRHVRTVARQKRPEWLD